MAVTAKFQADFSDFLRKAQQAGDSLEDLQKAAGSTTATVTRLANSFSGQSMIRNAADAVEAVKEIGGVSKLSESEMQRLGVQLGEASQKMERMGITVPTAMRNMQTEIAKATEPSMFQKFSGALDKVGLSLGLITGGALVAFAKGAIDTADNIGDLSEKTGLSTDAVQRFGQAFGPAGVELEALGKGSQKLAQNLAKGGDGTIAALDALGLSLSDLRTKSPEQAMTTVITALAGVHDQGKKTAIAAELLGKGLAVSAGAFNEANVAAMNHAEVLGGDAVDAASEFSDAETKMGRSMQFALLEGIAPLLPALSKFMDIAGSLAGVVSKVLRFAIDGLVLSFNVLRESATSSLASLLESLQKLPFADKIPGAQMLAGAIQWLKDDSKAAGDAIARQLNPALYGSADASSKAADSIGEFNAKGAKTKEVSEQVERLTKSLQDQIERYEKLKQTVDKVADTPDWFRLQKVTLLDSQTVMSRTIQQTEEINKKNLEWAQQNGAVLAPSLKNVGNVLSEVDVKASHLSDAISKMGATITQAFSGGGNPLKALGSSLGGALGEDLGEAVAKKIGGKLGSALGSAMGPLGALAGSLLGDGMSKAMGWIKGIFSDPMKKEVQAANVEIEKLQNKLIDQFGPLDELERKANAVGLSFKEAWGHQGKDGLAAFSALVDQFTAKWNALNAELDTTKGAVADLVGKAADLGYTLGDNGEIVSVSFQKMRDLAQSYGVDLASLGPMFQQAQLSDACAKLIGDFDLLTKGGADVGGVLLGMSDEVNKLVQDSMQFGTTIPKNMQPMIQGLLDAGKLTDAQGNKLTSLEQVKFGEPVKTEFDKIVDALKPLLDKLAELASAIGGIAGSIASATADKTIHIGWQIDAPPDIPDVTGRVAFGGGVGLHGIQRFARGGMVGGSGEGDSVPAMLTPGEGVLSRRGMQALAKLNHGGNVGNDPALRAEMRAMREEFSSLARTMRDLPRAMKLAVQEGILLA